MKNLTFGFAICGSFCTFSKAIEQLHKIADEGYNIIPIMSQTAYYTDTRFGKADHFIWDIEDTCNKKIIKTIVDAEPIGPNKMVDIMIVAPCTGNTLAKIANGITDTPVTMAVKSALRIGLPVVIALSTNDALSSSAQNIGRLLNVKNIYFVPLSQDNPENKPTSAIANFDLILPTALEALQGKQLQPVIM